MKETVAEHRLLADDEVDLDGVLEELHHLTERERRPVAMAGTVGRDPEDRYGWCGTLRGTRA